MYSEFCTICETIIDVTVIGLRRMPPYLETSVGEVERRSAQDIALVEIAWPRFIAQTNIGHCIVLF